MLWCDKECRHSCSRVKPVGAGTWSPQALQAAIQQFRAFKRAKVEVAQIPRQPPPCVPPPPPAPPDPMSPHPNPPPPLPHSPSTPVPPPDPFTAPTFHPVTTPFPSFPHIAVPVPDPTPRSRTPRRDTNPLFPELIQGSHPPWEQQPGVTPVGAPGTTPLRPPSRPPGIPADPNTQGYSRLQSCWPWHCQRQR